MTGRKSINESCLLGQICAQLRVFEGPFQPSILWRIYARKLHLKSELHSGRERVSKGESKAFLLEILKSFFVHNA
jgi:hypothetical protein